MTNMEIVISDEDKKVVCKWAQDNKFIMYKFLVKISRFKTEIWVSGTQSGNKQFNDPIEVPLDHIISGAGIPTKTVS